MIQQVGRDVYVLAKDLAQSIALSQQLPDQVEDVLGMGLQSTATVTGRLDYAIGGHNPPLIRHAHGSVEWLSSKGDMALGVMSDMSYTTASIKIKSGDLLLNYTDGITEAFNPAQEAYGEERLIQFIRNNLNAKPQEIVEQLFCDVAELATGAAQSDDITVAALN